MLVNAAAILATVKTATSNKLNPSFFLDIKDIITITILSYKEMRKQKKLNK